MPVFQYSPAILAAYPQVVGGVIVAEGLRNAPTPDALRERFFAEQEAVKARIGDTPLSEIESLSAWRRAFSAFGVSPTQYRNAAEALLRRLTKKDTIPSINTLVDIGNLVSVRYGLPVAIFDRRQIVGSLTVHYADGSETFVELGAAEALHPEVGEVVFSDDLKQVMARRWCWRQSAGSAAVDDTVQAIITVEAQHGAGQRDVQLAVADLLDLLSTYAGGGFESAILGVDQPSL